MNMRQRTIKQKVSVTGIGLHTGEKVTLTFLPAPSNTGVVYVRTDINKDFYPNPNTVRGTQLCTQIFNGKDSISTVEHINAALSAFGIDNIIVHVNNIEIPILDGSSLPFIFLLEEAGIEELDAPKKFIAVKKALASQVDDKYVRVKPHNSFYIDNTINFNHPFIASTNQHWQGEINLTTFKNELSRARTFGFLKDIEYLQSLGMCLGGSLDCAVVLNEFGKANQDELRYPNEFVRHKTLDLIGDLFVVGGNVIGAFTAYKPGHEINNLLLQQIILPENHEIISAKDNKELSHIVDEIIGQNYQLAI